MASRPGLLTEWPWQKLGNYKYVLLAPWVVPSLHTLMNAARKGKQGWEEIDFGYMLIFPYLLMRMLHHQIWISLSRFQTARSPHRIVDRSLDFEQVDRERNWDDQILLHGLLFYIGYGYLPSTHNLPFWRTDGIVMMFLLHAGPVEFLYYWFHRALHHHFLYSGYHSHHHASIVTEPITSVIHPFAEHIVYYMLFSIPMFTAIFNGTLSILAIVIYTIYIDFMNNMGHCNFELVPEWLFHAFLPLKYLMYTPSFHSLHHTQFRTNYSLFMPFYDYIYGTMDKSSDELYESSLKGKEETPDVVHLTHPTTLQSIYHMRLGLASLASRPYHYILTMWPMAGLSMLLSWFCGSSFTVERNKLNHLKMQTWAIPRFNFQYRLSWEREAINDLIEKAILEADEKGVKVLSLGLLNQVWLIGDGLDDSEQRKAPKGTHLIPFTQFPSKKVRKDCTYYQTPALKIPEALENMHSCENWLPRRVMSAWRVAGIVHALEGWTTHECGDTMLEIEKIWSAALRHRFIPVALV